MPQTIIAARVTNIRARLTGSLLIVLIFLLVVGILYAVSLSQMEQAIVSLEEQVARAGVLPADQQTATFTQIDTALRVLREAPLGWGLLIVMAAVGTTVLTFRSIANPIEQLREATGRLAAGYLEERIPIEWADEFGQLATAFNKMAEQIQASCAELEERVAERTRELQEANWQLQRRAMQLEASAEVGRAITSVFDMNELLRRTVELIRERFGFYHAGIFLLDNTGEWAVLQEATGDAGAQMKAQGHRLAVGETSMVGWTALHRRPRIALDVGEDAVHFANPLLPHTRSEMTLPLMVGGRVLGVLDIQSTAEAAFDEDDVRVLQNMADQIAIALENARRISQETTLLETASPLYRVSRRLTTAMTEKEVAEAIIAAVADTGADSCAIGIFDPPESDAPEAIYFISSWRRDRASLVPPGARLPMSASNVPVHVLNNLWVVPDVTQSPDLTEEQAAFALEMGMRAMVAVPLRVRGRLMGFLAVSRIAPGPFAESALRLYEVLSDQAAVALERALLLKQARQQAERERLRAEIANRVRASTEVDTILQIAIRELGRALRSSEGIIYLGGDSEEPVTVSSAKEKAEG
jgi:GAF domain-containing protein/HAMP domain-containing protein